MTKAIQVLSSIMLFALMLSPHAHASKLSSALKSDDERKARKAVVQKSRASRAATPSRQAQVARPSIVKHAPPLSRRQAQATHTAVVSRSVTVTKPTATPTRQSIVGRKTTITHRQAQPKSHLNAAVREQRIIDTRRAVRRADNIRYARAVPNYRMRRYRNAPQHYFYNDYRYRPSAWTRASRIPLSALIVDYIGRTPIYACQAYYHGYIYDGTMRRGEPCFVNVAGDVIGIPRYRVLIR